MDAVKFINEVYRMCRAIDRKCASCPFHYKKGAAILGFPCQSVQRESPEKAVKIVEKWSREHPQKTLLQDFKEKYPNAKISKDDGTPGICPLDLGYEKTRICHKMNITCKDCWHRPLDEVLEE